MEFAARSRRLPRWRVSIGRSTSAGCAVRSRQLSRASNSAKASLHTLGALGLDARECCCVEDSLYGIEAGCRAGLTVVAKREDRFGFSQAEADVIIDEIPDVLSVGERLTR